MSHSAWLSERCRAAGLSKTHQRVADALVADPQLGTYGAVTAIAEQANTTSGSVVRFAQALGFRGWPDLQQELRARYLAELSTDETRSVHADTDDGGVVRASLRRDIANLQATAELLDDVAVASAVDLIRRARRTLVVASGSYSAIGHVFAHLGRTLGLAIEFEGRGGVHLASAAGQLDTRDCLITVSFWRQFRELSKIAAILHQDGVPILAITDSADARTALNADCVIKVPSEGVSFFQSITAATSVVYGLLAEIEKRSSASEKGTLARTQRLWSSLDVYD